MNVQFTDNSDEVLLQFAMACHRALEECGLVAEGYAKKLCPVDTGNLRNSISHQVSDHEAFVGTNSKYGVYVELGTGKYVAGGRPTPWVYQDANGDWHKTSGKAAAAGRESVIPDPQFAGAAAIGVGALF